MNPKNTVFDGKRLIGRKFSEPSVQDDIKHFSFTVKVSHQKLTGWLILIATADSHLRSMG